MGINLHKSFDFFKGDTPAPTAQPSFQEFSTPDKEDPYNVSIDQYAEHIKPYEGFKGYAYKPVANEKGLTVGYGHKGEDVYPTSHVTEQRGMEILKEDIKVREGEVKGIFKNWDQYPAAIKKEVMSNYFRGSIKPEHKFVKLMNEGNFVEAGKEFLRNEDYKFWKQQKDRKDRYTFGLFTQHSVASRMEALATAVSQYGAEVGTTPIMRKGLKAFAGGEDLVANLTGTNTYKSGWERELTKFTPTQEKEFRSWVKENNVPFDVSKRVTDYDMRGFYQDMKAGKLKTAIDPYDKKIHYPDTYKTPLHETFSNESKWATENAPSWNSKDQLVDKKGKVLFDPRKK